MTQKTISARNRANAQKSTGPKSQKGKAASARNARRHGLTSRPDPAQVLAWLAIILDDPDVSPESLFPNDERGIRALALARAEARLATAERSLKELGDPLATGDPVREMEFLVEIIQEPQSIKASPWDILRAADFIFRIADGEKVKFRSIRPTQFRLLDRYVSEARSRRRKAFSDWVSGGEDVRSAEPSFEG